MVPMLTEDEWKEIAPLLRIDTERTKQLRREKNIGLAEALYQLRSEACQKYYELTGFKEGNWQAIYTYRLSDYGPECPECGKLFRTPKAKFCAECGHKK